MTQNVIRVVGARQHNLKNITVEIPRDKLVVITGLVWFGQDRLWPSIRSLRKGSGATSSRFRLTRASSWARWINRTWITSRGCRRRYPSTRKPLRTTRVRRLARSPKSTTTCACYSRGWASRTARSAGGWCRSNRPRKSWNRSRSSRQGTRVLVLAPIVRARKGTYQAVFDEIRKAGFVRVRVDGKVYQPGRRTRNPARKI